MKKLLSLMLCIVFVCLSLVSCVEDIIGEYLPNYKNNNVTDDQIEKLNLYIITGDNTSDEAKITVPQNINAYIKESYNISLNIKYYTESEYNAAVSSAITNTNEAERPDIILINSESMYNDLRAEDRLVALNDFYKSRDFRSINTIIDDVLLTASAEVDSSTGALTYYTAPNNHLIGDYEYIVIDKSIARDVLHFSNTKIEAMTTQESLAELKSALDAYYDANADSIDLSKEEFINNCVRVTRGNYSDMFLLEYGLDESNKKNYVNIDTSSASLNGEYTYIVIDREMAAKVQYTSEAIAKLTTEASLVNIKNLISNELTEGETVDKYVKVVTGNYDYRTYLEYGVENSLKKNFVNVSSYPVATKAQAHLSAFAIVKQLDDNGNPTEEQAAILNSHYSKCMKIIYALNTDVQLKNMLQYGYVGTNYKFEKNEKNENTNYITLINGEGHEEVTYEMNPIHTGNLFLNYYCEEINWNDKVHNDTLRQNAEAKLPD